MKPLVLMRGGGDIASGAVYRLRRAGYPVVISEIAIPTMIRREVCYGNAVHRGEMILERFVARHVSLNEVKDTLAQEIIPVVTSSYEELLDTLKPEIVVDAILSKKNLGTKRDDADLVIGVGPGFTAGEDVDVVIETMRGHSLGRCIYDGPAQPITGILRGILKSGLIVSDHFKLADVDARCEESHCYSISDKSLAVGGGVLEAVTAWDYERNLDGNNL